jgi:ApaG protein
MLYTHPVSVRRPSWLARAVEALLRRSLEQALAAQAQRNRPPTLAAKPTTRHSAAMNTTFAEPISTATTDGIEVTVRALYIAEQSSPKHERFVFAYTVAIANRGNMTAQLKTRHWVITDGRGSIEEVRGDGVIGEQPRLGPGQSFQYTSGCVLTTPIGTMHGTYRMWRDDGSYFDAAIAPFSLAGPHHTNDHLSN